MRYCFYLLIFLLTGCKSDDIKLHGYVEGDYQYISSTTSGILKDLYVRRGDFVKNDATLFAIEDTELKASIEKSKASIRQAEAESEEKTHEYLRAQQLRKTKSISQAELDLRKSTYNASSAKLDGTKQDLISAENKLKDSSPKAITDGYIENTFFVPGEFTQAGKPVISFLSLDNIKIRFFIPQDQLPKITQGQYVTISCDGSKKKIKAKITFISSQAEYTPPVIYSTDARQKMVFLVEAKPDAAEEILHPGLPVDIEIEGK